MKHFLFSFFVPLSTAAAIRTLVACSLLVFAAHGIAAPGAHGPNGEHLDDRAAVRSASIAPRVEAHTEIFELVAELRKGEFAIVLDRYTTNEPVLGAKVEVEAGPAKASAEFRPEQGDYVVTDPAFIKALSSPGEHSLVFTILEGQDSDLLDATFRNTDGGSNRLRQHDHDHEHEHEHEFERALWGAAGLGALGLIGGVALWRQRQRRKTVRQGDL